MITRCYHGEFQVLRLRPPNAGTVVTGCYHGVSRMLRPRHHVLERLPSGATTATGHINGSRRKLQPAARFAGIGTAICCVRRTSGHMCCIRRAAAASTRHAVSGRRGRSWGACASDLGRERGFFFFFLSKFDGQLRLDPTLARRLVENSAGRPAPIRHKKTSMLKPARPTPCRRRQA